MKAAFRADVEEGVGYFSGGWSRASAEFLREHKCKKLVLSGHWGNLSFLAEFADLIEEIVLENEDRDAAGVEALKNLKVLRLRLPVKNGIDFARLPKLEQIEVRWHPGYTKSLFSLTELKGATIKSFGNEDFTSCQITSPKLDQLHLVAPKLVRLSGIRGFKSLTSLQLDDAKNLVELGELATLSGLRKLTVREARSVQALDVLADLRSLESLALSHVGQATVLPNVFDLKCLKSLAVIGSAPLPFDFEGALRRSHLERIALLPVVPAELPSHSRLSAVAAEVGKRIVKFEVKGSRSASQIIVLMDSKSGQ